MKTTSKTTVNSTHIKQLAKAVAAIEDCGYQSALQRVEAAYESGTLTTGLPLSTAKARLQAVTDILGLPQTSLTTAQAELPKVSRRPAFVMFLREVESLCRAGYPVSDAWAMAARSDNASSHLPRIATMFDTIKAKEETVSAEYRDLFTESVVAVLHAGVKFGNCLEACQSVAERLEAELRVLSLTDPIVSRSLKTHRSA